jgi:hypothetical protein
MLDRLEVLETQNPRILEIRYAGDTIGELLLVGRGIFAKAPPDDDRHSPGPQRFGPFAEKEAAIAALVEWSERAP